jgi:hypothetical protein
MDETGARAVLERVAGDDAPPTRIDIALARRKGFTRLLWRLVAIVGVVPVIAVAGVVVGGALPLGPSGHRPAVTQESPAAAPHRFNPLVSYARFGWLPGGKHVTTAYTGATAVELEAGPTGSPRSWTLLVYAADSCNHTSDQLLGLLHGGHHPTLKCTLNWHDPGGRPAVLANPVFAIAPLVNGQRAFWAQPVCDTHQCNMAPAMLVWSYAPGGWARLSGPSRSDTLEVAHKVIFGATASQAIRFPVMVTGANPSWRVGGMVQSAPAGGVLEAEQWSLGTTATAPSFTVLPQGSSGGFCSLLPASADRHRIINGFRVTTTITAKGAQICALHARGMSVYIFTGAKVTPDAIAIFAHHLRLLGPDPAAWTTRPLGGTG